MSITFNSAGGFLNGTISSSGNNIFIQTSGSIGSINVGNVEYTGSQVIEKDSAGKVRFKKTFNDDGTITQEKFDQNEIITETKVKDPSSGKEFIRSGSATSNQIEFKQDTTSAEITLSGSGINKLTFLGSNETTTSPGYFQRQDTPQGTIYSQNTASVKVVSTGIDSAGDYFISPNNITPILAGSTFSPVLKVTFGGDVSMSGDLGVTGDISATSLNVTHFTSSFVTSSTITTEGNTIFGDTDSDSHTFNGNITASGVISASADADSFLGGKLQLKSATPGNQQINFGGSARIQGNNSYLIVDPNGQLVFLVDTKININSPLTGIGGFVTNDTPSATLHISGAGDTTLLVEGNITASGNISGSATSTGSFGMGFFEGRVGIGDTPIDAPLEVHLGDTSQIISDRAGNGSNIVLKRSGATRGTLSVSNTSGQEFEIFSSGDLIFNESDGDNVGIGMTSPSAKLDVTGDLRVSSHITSSGNISSSHTGSFGKLTIGAPPTMTHANTQLTVAGGSGGVDIASFYRNISGTGRVNISFSDSDPTIEFFEDSNDKTNSIGSDATNSNFVFATGSKLKNKEAMVIQNDGGNVGIGTTSPGEVLEVVGNISSSGTGSFGRVEASTIAGNSPLTVDSELNVNNDISSSGNIFGKQYFPTWHQYNDTNPGEENFIPSPSGYIVESTSINYYRQWLAPYNGKLVKAIIRPGSACGDTVLKLYVNGSVVGTTAATDVPRFNAVTFTDFSESSGVTTFSAGNVLAFSVTPTNSPTDVNICLVWEYDIGS